MIECLTFFIKNRQYKKYPYKDLDTIRLIGKLTKRSNP